MAPTTRQAVVIMTVLKTSPPSWSISSQQWWRTCFGGRRAWDTSTAKIYPLCLKNIAVEWIALDNYSRCRSLGSGVPTPSATSAMAHGHRSSSTRTSRRSSNPKKQVQPGVTRSISRNSIDRAQWGTKSRVSPLTSANIITSFLAQPACSGPSRAWSSSSDGESRHGESNIVAILILDAVCRLNL